MTIYYNIWRTDFERWVNAIDPVRSGSQDSDHPDKLSYIEARQVLEYWRAGWNGEQVAQLRILNADDTPGDEVGFNVWLDGASYNRWTNSELFSDDGDLQDTKNPIPSTYNLAMSVLNNIGNTCAAIKEINSDMKPSPVFREMGQQKPESQPPPIHVEPPEAPVEAKFDFEGYYGLKPQQSKYSYDQITKAAKVDPYTGLPIK